MTLGLTDGTNQYGIGTASATGIWAGNNQGNSISTTGFVSGGIAGQQLGLTTDGSKSGITARPSIKSLSAYVRYCIKY